MAINTPTYYGPAPTKGSQSTAIDAQTEGTLAAIVLQPVEQAPAIDADNNLTYVEIWKGPYAWAKNIYSYDPIDRSREEFITLVRGEVQVIERFNPPHPGTDNSWFITNVSVRELEAGDHGEIRITYTARDTSYDPGQAWNSLGNKDVWTLDWQSYSVTPYAFCKNDPIEDPPTGNPLDTTSTAWRKNIEDFFQSQSGDKSKFEYAPTTFREYFLTLNEAERLVAKKVIEGKNAVYHYPVLKHHQEWNKKFASLSASVEFPNTLGEDIDHIVSMESAQLSSCPYKFPTENGKPVWTWTKTGDTMTQTKDKATNTVTFARDTIYWGTKDPDINFYGNVTFNHQELSSCRWEIGKV